MLILLIRGMVLHYEYQHGNKGYSKLKYADVFKPASI